MDSPSPRRTRLTPERAAELYEAALDLLCEVGYEGLTMDAVAARTRSSKATLYRQWKGKPQLIASALRHHKPFKVEDIDTGTLRGDLLALAAAADPGRMERDMAILRGLGHAVHCNADLNRALREELIEPETAEMRRLLQRAVDRGEIASDTPALEFVSHMMLGAFVVRPLIEDRPADPEYLTRFVEAALLPALGL
ncbi:TetR/AcrR family transcriptional regulator [Streptomyces sp. AV19]|uniref:TetR/AcrR family transcriptional regulator n=1 Tax=Streptomyces sp. AV19 TaxID=2793068 RepID=UPI0018FE76C9|nr:TetR/AcrR family transcriptional regulator [Streptomyces sp. AV19]MBH1935371.1 TetR/AcrR family transcriptional regulator [Streptomyces sp. AV19]MDG4531257.1 TetR/AcrR family transcriptional regulator [Streptomyces sp. AV19]